LAEISSLPASSCKTVATGGSGMKAFSSTLTISPGRARQVTCRRYQVELHRPAQRQ
jgi:hypothetical protein